MIGPVCSRFSGASPANLPAHPDKISTKSFVNKTLTYNSNVCRNLQPIMLQTLCFQEQGEGGIQHPPIPKSGIRRKDKAVSYLDLAAGFEFAVLTCVSFHHPPPSAWNSDAESA